MRSRGYVIVTAVTPASEPLMKRSTSDCCPARYGRN
jgi:hypothetical protein